MHILSKIIKAIRSYGILFQKSTVFSTRNGHFSDKFLTFLANNDIPYFPNTETRYPKRTMLLIVSKKNVNFILLVYGNRFEKIGKNLYMTIKHNA